MREFSLLKLTSGVSARLLRFVQGTVIVNIIVAFDFRRETIDLVRNFESNNFALTGTFFSDSECKYNGSEGEGTTNQRVHAVL